MLQVVRVALHRVMMDCELANLTINDGGSSKDPIVAQMCTLNSTQVITSTTNIILMHVTAQRHDAHFAFKLRWEAIGKL